MKVQGNQEYLAQNNKFIKGEICRGKIKKVFSKGYFIEIRGEIFKINLSKKFNIGDMLFLKIKQIKPDIVFEYNDQLLKKYINEQINNKLLLETDLTQSEKEIIANYERILDNKVNLILKNDIEKLLNEVKFYLVQGEEVIIPIIDEDNKTNTVLKFKKDSFKVVINYDDGYRFIISGFKQDKKVYINIKCNNKNVLNYLKNTNDISNTENFVLKVIWNYG